MNNVIVNERKPIKVRAASVEIRDIFSIKSNHTYDNIETLENIKENYAGNKSSSIFIVDCLQDSSIFTAIDLEEAESLRDGLTSMINYVKGIED